MRKNKTTDRFSLWRLRDWATAHASGRVLEIGAGSGPNLGHYPAIASEIYAFDPDGDSLAEIEDGNTRVRVTLAQAESLPFPGESFDSAVGTLVFCTVGSPLEGLREVRRVLKPGAHLRLVEHVSSPNPVIAGFQHAVTPAWKRVAGGCHLDRQTAITVRRAGFDVRRVQPRFFGVFIGIDAVRP